MVSAQQDRFQRPFHFERLIFDANCRFQAQDWYNRQGQDLAISGVENLSQNRLPVVMPASSHLVECDAAIRAAVCH